MKRQINNVDSSCHSHEFMSLCNSSQKHRKHRIPFMYHNPVYSGLRYRDTSSILFCAFCVFCILPFITGHPKLTKSSPLPLEFWHKGIGIIRLGLVMGKYQQELKHILSFCSKQPYSVFWHTLQKKKCDRQ